MTHLGPGDILVVEYPFTDFSSSKFRPLVVISPRNFSPYGDLVVIALTSQDPQDEALRLGEWQGSGLPKPTWVKPILITIAASKVVRKLGSLAAADQPRVAAAVARMIAPQFL